MNKEIEVNFFVLLRSLQRANMKTKENQEELYETVNPETIRKLIEAKKISKDKKLKLKKEFYSLISLWKTKLTEKEDCLEEAITYKTTDAKFADMFNTVAIEECFITDGVKKIEYEDGATFYYCNITVK